MGVPMHTQGAYGFLYMHTHTHTYAYFGYIFFTFLKVYICIFFSLQVCVNTHTYHK